MVLEKFRKYDKIAQKRAEKERGEKEEAEERRKAKVAKKTEEEAKRRERLLEQPKIREVTDEEAVRIQAEIDEVFGREGWGCIWEAGGCIQRGWTRYLGGGAAYRGDGPRSRVTNAVGTIFRKILVGTRAVAHTQSNNVEYYVTSFPT